MYVLTCRLMPLARREGDEAVVLELPVEATREVSKLNLEGLAKIGPVAVRLNSKLGVELQRGVAEVRRDLPYLPCDFKDEGAIEQRKARARGPTSLAGEGNSQTLTSHGDMLDTRGDLRPRMDWHAAHQNRAE